MSWSGLAPLAGLLEYVFGLRADAPNGRLLWDVRLLDEHGVGSYPFGSWGVVDLACAARGSAEEEPQVRASSTVPLTLVLRWEGGQRYINL